MSAHKVLDATRKRTPTADRVPDTTGWNTPTAVRVLATMEEVLSRPSEYPRRIFLIGQSENLLRYSDGRESASSLVASILTAVGVFYSNASGTLTAVIVLHPAASCTLSAIKVFHPIASSTLSAVTILAQKEEAPCRPLECFLD